MGVIWYIIGVISGALILVVCSCCRLSGQISRMEEREQLRREMQALEASDRCDGCLRWPECNGVDLGTERCPGDG